MNDGIYLLRIRTPRSLMRQVRLSNRRCCILWGTFVTTVLLSFDQIKSRVKIGSCDVFIWRYYLCCEYMTDALNKWLPRHARNVDDHFSPNITTSRPTLWTARSSCIPTETCDNLQNWGYSNINQSYTYSLFSPSYDYHHSELYRYNSKRSVDVSSTMQTHLTRMTS